MESCIICIEEYKDGDVVVKPKTCDHMFHLHCIAEWISRKLPNPTCPYCRQSMVFERSCNQCTKVFWTPYSIQVTCDVCCCINGMMTALEYLNAQVA